MSSPRVMIEEIKMVPVSELKPHPKNRNKHPSDQIERLAKILEYQGFRYPVKVSNRSGFVTSGHGRIEAAKLKGWTHVPVSYQDYDDDDQEYLDVQSDNAIASWSELDLSGINADLESIGPFDLDLLGIKDFVLEPSEKYAGCDEDEVPEPKESIAKLGDVWQLGKHRLMCGDSTDIGAVERLMNGEKADMVFTDPPYGMDLDADYSKMHKQVAADSTAKAKAGSKGSKWKNVEGDDEPFDPNFILGYFNNISEIFLWGGDYYCDKLPIGTFIVWDKNNGSEGADKMIGNAYEMAWSKQKHKKVMARIFGRGTFGHDKVKVHPTQKPVQLAEWFFERWGKDTKTVIDLYGGSGSTLIACEKTSRRCFMMEIDPHYVDVIIARWEKYTGKEAYLLKEDGKQIAWSELNAKG